MIYLDLFIPEVGLLNHFKKMSIKINYSKKISSKTSSNQVLFCDEKYNINGLRKYISNTEFSYINDLLKTIDLKTIYFFLRLILKKIVLVSIKNNSKTSDVENLGALILQINKSMERIVNTL